MGKQRAGGGGSFFAKAGPVTREEWRELEPCNRLRVLEGPMLHAGMQIAIGGQCRITLLTSQAR